MIIETPNVISPATSEPPASMQGPLHRRRKRAMAGTANTPENTETLPEEVRGRPKWVIPVAVAGAVAVAGGGYLYTRKGKKKGK